jgi:hypothetical protein
VFGPLEVEIRIKGNAKISKHVIALKHAPIPGWLVKKSGNAPAVPTNMSPMLQKWAEDQDLIWERHPRVLRPTMTNPPRKPLSRAAQLELLATTLVCRQMYLDTALLPFQYFTFASEHLSWLTSWMQLRLLPAQHNVISILKMRLEEVIYQAWANMKPRGGSYKDSLMMEPSTMKILVSFPQLRMLILTDFDAWTNWSRPTIEMVQEMLREKSGLKDLIVERSEDRMFGGV